MSFPIIVSRTSFLPGTVTSGGVTYDTNANFQYVIQPSDGLFEDTDTKGDQTTWSYELPTNQIPFVSVPWNTAIQQLTVGPTGSSTYAPSAQTR